MEIPRCKRREFQNGGAAQTPVSNTNRPSLCIVQSADRYRRVLYGDTCEICKNFISEIECKKGGYPCPDCVPQFLDPAIGGLSSVSSGGYDHLRRPDAFLPFQLDS